MAIKILDFFIQKFLKFEIFAYYFEGFRLLLIPLTVKRCDFRFLLLS